MFFDFIKSRYGGKKAFLKYHAYKILSLFWGNKRYKKITGPVGRVVFVCKGNICRSAWAECYFKSISSLPVCSFGLDTTSGNLAEEKIIAYAKNHGLDLSCHVTTAVANFQPRPNDLYVCMEPVHVNQLLSTLDLKRDDIVLLGMWYSKVVPYIHDPYSCDADFTNRCLDLISVSVDNINFFISDKTRGNAVS